MTISLLDRIRNAKGSLKTVETSVTLEDGSEVVERRSEDGTFQRISVDDTNTENTEQVSNRRRKKVERARRCGFVIDLKPDMQLAQITEYLYLGSQDVAASYQTLKEGGITHIVNCATGIRPMFPKNFIYLMVEMLDLPTAQLKEHFTKIHQFIDQCRKEGGKVFVHCNAGISRASSFVISYLMKDEQLSYQDAFEKVRRVRPVIRPNDGFRQQLIEYNEELQNENK